MIEKVSLSTLRAMKARREPIVSLTAYDAPSARQADAAGVDIILVGDSAAMTVLGHASTVTVTVDDMLVLTAAAARATRRAMVLADMPFGSFQVSDEAAVANAVRFIKAGADAVKIEGAGPSLSRVRALIDAGIAVMGHVGLTPQSATKLGGYKAQGRSAAEALQILADARALEAAGCFAVVLEAVPAVVGRRISESLEVPTIGIGAGPDCDGQVLVWHDVLGLTPGHVAKFVRQYANLGEQIATAVSAYVADVRGHRFPAAEHTYGMADVERAAFDAGIPGPDRPAAIGGKMEGS